jgi:hypothetical protein
LLGVVERFGVFVERIGLVDLDGELAAGDEAGDFSVAGVDVLAGCLAQPVDGPEAVVADVAVDQVLSYRSRGWLAAERAEADDLAAEAQPACELGDGSSASSRSPIPTSSRETPATANGAAPM